MTDEELALAEAVFRNPPSASVPSELGLRLCEEVRKLKAVLVSLKPIPLAPDEPTPTRVDIPAPPTPPASPAAKAKAKK